MQTWDTYLETIKELYATIDTRAAPFSETEIHAEQDPEVQRAMIYVTALLGLKVYGRARINLENNKNSAYLGKALAKLCVAKKLDTSQALAMINQLFQ
jgi:hypothetical protein